MTIDERIAWAKKQRNIAYKKDSVQGIVYWDGYLDALKAVQGLCTETEVSLKVIREIEKIIDKHYNKHIFDSDLTDTEIEAVMDFSADISYDIYNFKDKYTEGEN